MVAAGLASLGSTGACRHSYPSRRMSKPDFVLARPSRHPRHGLFYPALSLARTDDVELTICKRCELGFVATHGNQDDAKYTSPHHRGARRRLAPAVVDTPSSSTVSSS